jgi:hypothetical protein
MQTSDWLLTTVSSIVATIMGGWVLNRIEQRRLARTATPTTRPLAFGIHGTRRWALQMFPVAVAVAYVTPLSADWSLSVLETLATILVTATAALTLVLMKDYLIARLAPPRREYRSLGFVASLACIVLAINAADHALRDRLSMSLPDLVEENEVVRGQVLGEPQPLVFLLIRPVDASGEVKHSATRPDNRGEWAAAVTFGGPSGSKYLVHAVAIHPYVLPIIGDPASTPADRIDEIATMRSHTRVVEKK